MSEIDPADTFRQEAADLLDKLEAALLDLGHRPDDRDLINTAFRALHTIKGSGSMFGFDRVAAFTHEFETAFDLLRQGRIAVTSDIVAVSLAARDQIRALIEDDGADDIIGEAILDELRRYVGTGADNGPSPPPATAAAPPPADGWSVRITFEPEILANGTNPLVLLDDLRALGPCAIEADLSRLPPLDRLDPVACLLGWTVRLDGGTRDAIDDVFLFTRDEMTLEIVGRDPAGDGAKAGAAPAPAPDPASDPGPDAAPAPVLAPAAASAAPDAGPAERRTASGPPPAARPASKPASRPAPGASVGASAEAAAPRASAAPGSTVRVRAERLDELMDRVGELVIAQARLSQIANASSDLAIKSLAEEIERLASGLRHVTMGVRMVPMGMLFGRFRRLLHDLSRDLGKPVELVTSGEDTELDKTMIEHLADPLVHMIRNAIDHGIEAPGLRAAAGKPAVGRITLSASHVGAQVVVSIADDGAGLDTDRIRAKAEEAGLLAPDASVSEAEIHQFLFHPGFSTARTISALSGRGVGMDVVKRTIEGLRGTVELATVRGGGTTTTLRLPLTLAIIEGLLVRVGAGHYIIPLSAVEECIEMSAGDDRRRGRSFLNVRGALVPFLRLRDLFAEPGEPAAHQKIIIVNSGETRIGLVVDQIIGSHQTVIKSLSKLHADATSFSGATILGDGSAALILDVVQLVAGGGETAALPEAA